MRRSSSIALTALATSMVALVSLIPAQTPRGPQPPVQPKPEELAQVKTKTEQIEELVQAN